MAPLPSPNDRRARLAAARLYLICDSHPGERELEELLPGAAAGGIDVVQLRDKQASDGELAQAAARARLLCDELGLLLIVNDRPEVALAVGADGVHLGQADEAVAAVRQRVGPQLLIGLSTHSPAQVDAATVSADYLGVGPVYATPTKPGRPAVGLALVRHAARVATVPFFAIGGINASNLPQVLAAGAKRIAVVRAIGEAADPRGAARTLRDGLEPGAVGRARAFT